MTPTSFAGYLVTCAVAAYSLTLRDAVVAVEASAPFDFVVVFRAHLRARMNDAATTYAIEIAEAERRGYLRGQRDAAFREFAPTPIVIDCEPVTLREETRP